MKKFLFIAIFVFIAIAIIILVLEIFLRMNPRFGYCARSFRQLTVKENQTFPRFAQLCMRPSPLLGYEHIPNCGNINSYGMIGKSHRLEKEAGIYRILVLGDSIAEQGWSCEALEGYLNKSPLLNKKYKFEVWNSGVASYDVRRYFLYLKHKGLQYKPDMVVIFFCMNDFNPDINIYYRDKRGAIAYCFPLQELYKRDFRISPFLLRSSYLYRFVILRMENYLVMKQKSKGFSLFEENGRHYLGHIKDTCEKEKIPLRIVVFPYLKPLNDYYDWQMEEYATMNKVIEGLGVNYINLHQYIPEKEYSSMRERKDDDTHPNELGHHRIAKIIYDYLLGTTNFN